VIHGSRRSQVLGRDDQLGWTILKAILNGTVLADSDDTVAVRGYDYFPLASARTEWLEKSPRTPKDLECPHGVQFYDVVLQGQRYPRNAWIYEAPQPAMSAVADRVGFWKDVQVG
jgi:uncharacterized protein (DUF427 family)